MAYHPFRHLGLKLLSVAIALGMWLALAGEQVVERSLRVPLELQNKPEQLELVDSPPSQVEVRVRGASGLLSHLVPGDVVGVLDLTGVRAGRRILHLTRTQVRAPFGVEILQVAPSSVSLSFESSLTKTVPVEPVIDGQPAQGYTTGQVTVEPPAVEVVGAESAVRRLKEATTEPVSVAGATRRVRETVNVGVADGAIRLKSSISATVTIEVRPSPVERVVPGIRVEPADLAAKRTAQITPRTVSVLLRGPSDLVNAVRPADVRATVDLAPSAPGRYNRPVRVEPLQNVVVVRVDPPTVGVRIK